MDDELAAELLTRRDEDQRVRRQLSGFVRQPEARVPIEDPGCLDERRSEAGLEPFAAYEMRMRDRT